ncbi:uncharacterized protein LOC131036112 isoform X1 [Cryptomeria japonica]|uniref:uncharacterized protein LOC131036112 isoform X1 n=1 Tax=Cryptomeria japonica TaxID=3369 RepID=UPI0025AC227F|nr:uncharacterized protein LOC131036112 isoform X1 [Cryptomeria japonica]
MHSIQTSFTRHAHFSPNIIVYNRFHFNTSNTFKLAGSAFRIPRLRVAVKNREEAEWQTQEEKQFEDEVDPADILLGDFDDPEKMRKHVENRIKKKQKTIFQTNTGSAEPMNVLFNKFDYSDSYIWFEFEHAPSDNDLRIISSAIRSWFVLGHLGGYNSSNIQLTELPVDRQPSYDIEQANKNTDERITFENIGDIEIQDKLARIWVDIGNSDPLTLDVLINTLRSLSSEYIGIKQLVFGGKRWGNWKERKASSKVKSKVWKI